MPKHMSDCSDSRLARFDGGSSSLPLWWTWGYRNSINQFDQRDKERILRYHRSCLRVRMCDNFYNTAVAAFRPDLSAGAYHVRDTSWKAQAGDEQPT